MLKRGSELLLIRLVYKYLKVRKLLQVIIIIIIESRNKYILEVELFVTFKMAYEYTVYIFWSEFLLTVLKSFGLW
jgi:hypothetical protein